MNRRLAVLAAAALAAASTACGNGRPPAAAPPPPPAPAPAPVPAEAAPVVDPVTLCVLEGGGLREVEIRYEIATGDSTLADGRRVRDAYPEGPGSGYAVETPWYRAGGPITFGGRRYSRLGMSRVVSLTDLRRFGDHLGVPVFVEATHPANQRPAVLYIPLRRGCEFQAFTAEMMA